MKVNTLIENNVFELLVQVLHLRAAYMLHLRACTLVVSPRRLVSWGCLPPRGPDNLSGSLTSSLPRCVRTSNAMCQNLKRLDETNEEDSQGVHNTMGVIENLVEIDPQVCSSTWV